MRMKNTFGTLCRVLLIILIFAFSHCSPWDKSDVKIERFEYLDIPRSTPVAGDSLSSEAYLIHGYSRWHEEEIHEIVDNYVCDSIIPNRTFTRYKYITFFKKSKNTNRENFQVWWSLEQRRVHAKTRDKLFHYAITVKDSSITRMRKQKFIPHEPLPPSQVFHCN